MGNEETTDAQPGKKSKSKEERKPPTSKEMRNGVKFFAMHGITRPRAIRIRGILLRPDDG